MVGWREHKNRSHYFTPSVPRGVLSYISDGDARSPFLGLKFCSDFFGVRDFGKDFFSGLNWTFFGLHSGPLDFFWVRV